MTSHPNVLWITLDSVRYDHTSMSGYERDTTPEMERLAGKGRSFSNCFAQSNWTLGSSGALLTGTYPSHNTVGITGSTLPEAVPTVAERYREAGYRTLCISRNSYVSDATGLDRGFDDFSWIASSTLLENVGVRTLIGYALNIRSHSAGLETNSAKHASPYLVNGVAKYSLKEAAQSSDPFFCYLHYNEPHSPYYPPGLTADAFLDDIGASFEEASNTAMELHENLYGHIANGCDFSDRELELIQAMYDAEILYTDLMIGRLIDCLHELDLENTIVVITADHGELFGEQNLLEHKLVLDDAVTRVPMVVHGLDTELAVAENDLIQHIDIVRTIADYCGVDTSHMHGNDLRSDNPDWVISQRRPEDFQEYYEENPSFDPSPLHGPVTTALRTKEYKYQYSEEFDELFALPEEGKDVAETHRDTYQNLQSEVHRFLQAEGAPVSEGQDAEFSDAMAQQLQDLGYLE